MIKYTVILTGILMILFSCSKYEGTGGKSSISGKIVLNQRLYVNGSLIDSVRIIGSKEDVYIVYGEKDPMYDDKVECNHDGTFRFDFLQPGNYTIFAYNELFHSGISQSNNDDDYYTNEPVKLMIELGKNEKADAGTITLIK